MKIWRDIDPTDIWNETVLALQTELRDNSRSSEKFYNKELLPVLQPLTDRIRDYHLVPKTKFETLIDRINRLKQIHTFASEYLIRRQSYARKTDKSLPKNELRRPDEESRDRKIWSVRQRALRKAGYLDALYEMYKPNGVYSHLANPKQLKAFLETPRPSNDGSLEITRGEFMELMDPAHRSIGGKDEIDDLTQAFHYWLTIDEETPFFLWLEDQPICLGHDKRMVAFSMSNLDEGRKYGGGARIQDVKSILYDTEKLKREGRICSLYAWRRKLCCVDLGQLKEGVLKPDEPFDTSEWDPVHENQGKGCAYIVDTLGTIWVGRHKGGELHHSSLTGGRKVLCAGTLKVRDGTVISVSNDSGHYRPPTFNLLAFVIALEIDGVIGDGIVGEKCVVKWFNSKKEGLDKWETTPYDEFKNMGLGL
jgi:hypothetical protein